MFSFAIAGSKVLERDTLEKNLISGKSQAYGTM